MRRTVFIFALVLSMLLVGCDTAGPEPDADPEPHFEFTLGAPVNAAVEGEAALDDGTSFDEQSVFVLPSTPFGKTLTAIQLFGEDGGMAHDLSFVYLADAAITEGTYEIGFPDPCAGQEPPECTPRFFMPDSLLLVHYARMTSDSLYTYPIDAGTLTIERVTDEVVEGAFSLDAVAAISVSQADLAAFQDSLRAYMDNRLPGEDFNREDLPQPPPTDVRPIMPPMTIEGTFTAMPGTFSDRVPRSRWMMGFGAMTP